MLRISDGGEKLYIPTEALIAAILELMPPHVQAQALARALTHAKEFHLIELTISRIAQPDGPLAPPLDGGATPR